MRPPMLDRVYHSGYAKGPSPVISMRAEDAGTSVPEKGLHEKTMTFFGS